MNDRWTPVGNPAVVWHAIGDGVYVVYTRYRGRGIGKRLLNGGLSHGGTIARSQRAIALRDSRPNRYFVVAGVTFIICAIAFGGSAQYARISDLPVRLAAIIALMCSAWAGTGRKWHLSTRELVILAGVPLVPILQLLPLPPALWTVLPGRDIYVGTYSAAGMSLPWLPISLAPERTLDSALFTLAPMAGFILAAIADFRSLRCLSTAIVSMAFLSAIVASLQLATEPDHWLRFYEISSEDSPVGFFANRNHLGAFMAVCIPITWYWMANGTGHAQLRKLAAAGLITLFIATAVATQSRASIVLTGLSLSLSLVAFGRRRSFSIYITIIAVGLGLSLFIVSLSEQLIARFARLEALNYRADILPSLLRAARDVWLTGSGIGTFARLFPQYETISSLGPVYWNHAHNDWLQVMIEGGVPATLLLIAFLAWWIRMAIVGWNSLGQKGPAAATRAQLRLVTIVTLLLMLHSFVDYPLRTSTLSVIFAFYCGVACRVRHVSSL